MNWLFYSSVTILMVTSCTNPARQKPIALHPENPHYFIYEDKATVLITSGEHYGAVLNQDFNYQVYLEALSKEGLNLTRTFTGAYVEPQGAFKIERNTLAPQSGKFICPWAKSSTPGYANGGNKFDLSKWNDEYFTRLKDFMTEAEKRKIIVELTLFCPFYENIQWNLSPLNSVNNVNGLGPTDRLDAYTLDKSQGLLAVQEALVRKVVHELKDFSNLIYEICNEPYFGGVTMQWQHHIATVIQEAEKEFPHKHLISQNIANHKLKIDNPHAGVSVFNFHYASPPAAVAQNFHLNKVIGDNETGFAGTADSTYRREGWSFILAGGALYNNLDYSFTVGNENGTFKYPYTQPGGGSPALRRQLGYLKAFINGFDFVKMRPDITIIESGFVHSKRSQVLAEHGRQYAVYIFGKGPFDLSLAIPSGTYEVQFMDPLSGKFESGPDVISDGKVTLDCPSYAEDLAIKITAASHSE